MVGIITVQCSYKTIFYHDIKYIVATLGLSDQSLITKITKSFQLFVYILKCLSYEHT